MTFIKKSAIKNTLLVREFLKEMKITMELMLLKKQIIRKLMLKKQVKTDFNFFIFNFC